LALKSDVSDFSSSYVRNSATAEFRGILIGWAPRSSDRDPRLKAGDDDGGSSGST
jgi:hypothetical protein